MRKTLSEGFEIDYELFRYPDYQEEVSLQMRIEKFMLQNESESFDDEGDESNVQLVDSEPEDPSVGNNLKNESKVRLLILS